MKRVIELALAPPPGETTHWTGRMLATAAGVSLRSVQRILKAHQLAPHRVRTFKLSKDPKFAEKLRDIVGLYVDPPAHAIVLSVDEKSQIQALDRTQPGLPMKKGRAGTMTHDYKRRGTTTLFAALNYKKLPADRITVAFCWSHLRREFFKIAERGDAPIATEAVARIAQIYAVEKDVRGASADARRAARQARSRPLVDALKMFFEHQLTRLAGGSETAKIIRYGLRHWDGLTRFLDDGRIELDTNIVERSMRPQALTRKNALFAGHDDGAENWAILASLIETCLCRARHRAVYAAHRTIPRSRHDPKILSVDDAEIVGDRIAEVRPVPWNGFTQKTKRRIGELGAGCIAFVVRDVSVHEAPQPLDRIEMRTIGRDEMQLDPAAGSSKPFLHELGVMIARVVEKDMDERQHRIKQLDRFQEPDRRDGVDG